MEWGTRMLLGVKDSKRSSVRRMKLNFRGCGRGE